MMMPIKSHERWYIHHTPHHHTYTYLQSVTIDTVQKLCTFSKIDVTFRGWSFFFRMRLLRFFSDIRINMQETVDLNFTSTFFSSSNFCSDTFELIFFYGSTLWMHEGFNSDLFMFFASNGQKVTFVHQNIIQPLKNSWNHYILGTWPPLSTSNVSKSLFVQV